MSTYKKVSVVKLSANFREATKVVETVKRPPESDEILLKNIYAGVNATDINTTAGRYSFDGVLPFDAGFEFLGVIEAVGKDVTKYKVGQSGFGVLTPRRGFAEYVYLKPDEFIPLPDAKQEYIALLVCGLTATIGLDEGGRIKEGEKVLITAAAGGTGHICVQWAKRKGCYVIGTCSSNEKAKVLKELGCDRVINYKEESIDEVLNKEFPDGVDVIWETIGGSVFEMLFKHLKEKGRLVVIGGITGYQTEGFPDVNIPRLPTQLLFKSTSLVGFLVLSYAKLFPQYLKSMIELVNNKQLKIIVDNGENAKEGKFVGVESVVRGVEHLHSSSNTGKVVIKLQ